MAQSDPIEPQYTTDERADLATLRVSCYIPGLVVKRKFTTKKFIPKFIKQADNAVVKTNFQEDSFSFTVTGNTTGAMKGKVFELNIRKLPKLIVPAESSYEVKEDRIVIRLRKKVVESWYPELEEGLDAYEPPEEDETETKENDKEKTETKANDEKEQKSDIPVAEKGSADNG